MNCGVFIAKSTKKQLLLTNFGVITSIWGVSGLEQLSSCTEPVNFFGHNPLLGGHHSRLRGHGPEMTPWGARPVPGYQRWSPRGRPWPRGRPRGHILKSLALASRPQVLENWPVLGSRTAVLFELLKFCGALEKFFRKRFFVEIAWKIFVKTFFFFFLRSPEKFLWRPFFFFWRALALVSLVLGLGLGFFWCPWPWPWPRALCPQLHLCWLRLLLYTLAYHRSNLQHCFEKMKNK